MCSFINKYTLDYPLPEVANDLQPLGMKKETFRRLRIREDWAGRAAQCMRSDRPLECMRNMGEYEYRYFIAKLTSAELYALQGAAASEVACASHLP